MRIWSLATVAVLVLAMATASQAGEKPRAPQANQNTPKKVWTNEDLDALRSQGLLSIVGQDIAPAAAQPATPAPETPGPVYSSRLQDPAWYAEKIAELQAELQRRQAALEQQKIAMSLVADRVTQPGINMIEPNAGITPQSGLANLQAQVDEVQNELLGLEDLARANNIAPGVVGS